MPRTLCPGVATLTLTLTLTHLAVPAADATCPTSREILSLGKAIDTSLRCRSQALLDSSARCDPGVPPPCAAIEHDTIVRLVFERLPLTNLRAHSPDMRCQIAISAAARAYVRGRVLGLATQQRHAPRSALIRRVVRGCARESTGSGGETQWTAVGAPCASLLDDPTTGMEPLAACLSARLEAILGDALPEPIFPNMVIILTDDQRADSLEFMPETLARIAARGVRFENAFVSSAACTPSRATIYSGLYAHNHGLRDNAGLLRGSPTYDPENILPAWLQRAGYRTALFGHYMLFADHLGEQKPATWDEWWALIKTDGDRYTMSVDGPWRELGPEPHLSDLIAREALRFVRDRRNEPFFVVLAPAAPHARVEPAPRHRGRFAGLPPRRPPNFREPDTAQKPGWVKFARRIMEPRPSTADASRIAEAESLQSVDETVAQLSELLEQLGLTDRTLFLFLSDNGVQREEHWWDSKFTSYEESIRIPMLLRYPVRYPVPRRETSLVSNVDIAATIVDAAGIPAPELDGKSLLAVLDGELPPHEELLIENFTSFIVVPNSAIRTNRWKYIRTHVQAGIREELYDLTRDPYELRNLARDPAQQERKGALAARLEQMSRARGH